MSSSMTASGKPSTFLIIDGYGFVFRAFFAMPPLTTPQGQPAGAVFGFVKMITKLLQNPGVTHVCAALDHSGKSFRNDVYPDYKAHRPPAPDDLKAQFPLIREACAAMGIPSIEKEGYEADDIIACLVRRAEAEGMKAVIVSSDKDLMQLITDNISMYDPVKGKFSGRAEVIEKTGVPPELIGDFLALTGDVADNIPGVPGIGPKTASTLLNEYGNLQGILDHAPHIKQKKRREVLLEHHDNALLSRRLVELDDQACIDISPDILRRKDDHLESLRLFCIKMGFKSIVRDIEKGMPAIALDDISDGRAPDVTAEHVTQYTSVSIFIDALKKLTSSEYPIALNVYTLHERRYVCAAQNSQAIILPCASSENFTLCLQTFADMIEDAERITCAYDTKAIMRLWLSHHISCTPRSHEDAGLLSFVSGIKGGHDPINIIARDYKGSALHVPDKKSSEEEISLYAGFRSIALASSIYSMRERAEDQRVMRMYRDLEQPLQPILAAAEHEGIHIDIPTLDQLSTQFRERSDTLALHIYAAAGEEFNIGSPKQLGSILFEKLGLKPGKKTGKSKQLSTNAETLEELAAQGADIAADVLQWRHYTKLIGTYTEALPKLADTQHRIHTTFSMTAANTGRLSSLHPNVQNIPVRSENGGAIRAAFTASAGKKLISADYSQIELRLLAHIADMDSLKKAFAEGKDIHAATASEIFGLPIDQVSDEHRRKAKTVNFGIIYGISAYGLATRLRVTQQEAKEIIERYFTRYPGIRDYMESAKEEARTHQGIRTIFGRFCPIPDIASGNYALRSFGERAAINAPLQGAAADIIKRAMLSVSSLLNDRFPEAALILQVHDELIVEAPALIAETVRDAVVESMEKAANLSVPLSVDADIGDNWAQAH